jgi:hypothetical protein
MSMRSASNQDINPKKLHGWLAPSSESHDPSFRTTPGERALLFTTALIIPLDTHILLVPNVSSLFIMFAVLAAYVAINRLPCLDGVWMHPVFVAAYIFIGISAAAEFANPLSSSHYIGRFALMIGGAVLVASLCRDRAALKFLLYGHIGAALWLGMLLFLTSYGTLSGVAATDFDEASNVRGEAFRDSPLRGNLNRLAFSCVQGGVVALAFALGSASFHGRNIFALIGVFCLVASSLPMSRMAIIMALVGCTVVLKAYGIRKGKVWFLAGLISASALFLIPNAIWSRMTVKTGEGGRDSRVSYYENAIRDVGDYWFMGVGEGNYFRKWGFEKGYAHRNMDVMVVYGVHNAFLQVLIFWGVIALLAFLAIIFKAYRCVPNRCGSDPLSLSLLGLAVSFFLMLPFTHNLENKVFSLGLGMLVASQRWLTKSTASPISKN